MSADRPAVRRAGGVARPERLAVAALTLVALAIRVHGLADQPVWSDEGLSLHRAGLGLLELVRGRIVVDGYATTDPMPPLYFVLLAAGRALLGRGLWAARFIGAALSTAAVPCAWLAGRRWLGQSAGVATAAAATAAPFLIWYSQELRPYGLLVTIVMAMAALAGGRAGPLTRAACWSAAVVVATLLHPFALLAAVAQAPAVAPGAWRAAGPRLRAAAALMGVVAAAIGVSRALPMLTGAPQVDFAPVTPAVVARQALAAFAGGISPSLSHPWSALWPMAAFAAAAFATAVLDRGALRGVALAAAMLVVPVAGVLALSTINPLYNGPRHVIAAMPGFLLLVGASARLPGAVRRRGAARASADGVRRRRSAVATSARDATAGPAGPAFVAVVAALVLVVVAGNAVRETIEQLKAQFNSPDYVKDDLRSLVADLALRFQPGDAIVLHDALIGFTFDAEAEALGVRLPWTPIPHFPTEPEAAAIDRLLAIRPAPGGRIWFVDRPVPRGGFAAQPLVEAADKRWNMLDRRQYSRLWLKVALREYDDPTPSPASAIGEPVAEWANGLALERVVIERPLGRRGLALGQGQAVRLRGTWRQGAATDVDALWSMRLRSAAGDVSAELGSDRPRRETPLGALPAGTAFTAPLEAVVPFDAPRGPAVLQLRLVGNGGPDPALLAPAAANADGPWVTVAAVTVDAPPLPPGAVRALLSRQAGWVAAPAAWAGDHREWRLIAHSALPKTASPGRPMALSIAWQDVAAAPGVAGDDHARDYVTLLRLVDATGRQQARGETTLTVSDRRPGDLLTGSVTLAVPTGARGKLTVQAALGTGGGPPDGSAPVRLLPLAGRFVPHRGWVTLGTVDAEPDERGAAARQPSALAHGRDPSGSVPQLWGRDRLANGQPELGASHGACDPERNNPPCLSAKRPSVTLATAPPYRFRPWAV